MDEQWNAEKDKLMKSISKNIADFDNLDMIIADKISFALEFVIQNAPLSLLDGDLYSMSSWESSFMARPIVWLVGIRISGDYRRWHSLLLTSSTQSPPQRNTSYMADIISSHW